MVLGPGADVSTVRRRVVVSGRVQGVGFRYSCRDQAGALGVAGWVRNRPDGRVELEAEGPSDSVDGLVDWCRVGPPHSSVTAVEVTEVEVTGDSGFHVVA